MTTRPQTFSIEYSDAGFTDQLMQYSALYKLGQSLGLHYQYSPLFSPRSMSVSSTQGFVLWKISRKTPRIAQWLLKKSTRNIYNFLGTNQALRKLHQETTQKKPSTCIVNLSDHILEKQDIRSFESLQQYIQNKLAPPGLPPFEKLHLRIQICGPFMGWIQKAIPNAPNPPNFLKAYQEERKKDGWRSSFKTGRIKTVVHIRQGDTAILNTPWNSWINLNVPQKDLKETTTKETRIQNPVVPCEIFLEFLQQLIAHETPETFATNIYSDGFQLAYNKLLLHRKQIPLTLAQCNQLRRERKTCNIGPFKPFHRLPNTQVFIGEDHLKLCHFIDAVMQADLLIIGTQQRMLPKFIAHYLNEENSPLVVILHTTTEPPIIDLNRYGLASKSSRFIFFQYPNPDLPTALKNLSTRINECYST